MRHRILFTLLVTCAGAAAGETGQLRLDLRTRVQPFKGSSEWREVHVEQVLPVSRTAIVICDMWDKHWCSGASHRVDELAARMNPVLEKARAAGVQIIHAPSETMQFYKDAPQRLRILALAPANPPAPLGLTDPALPIDDSDGGCDTADQFYTAWTRENAGLRIAPEDVISDNGGEIYSFLKSRGIENLLIMGVHTNMCVLNRTFAIKQMTNWGERCILVRDLTDAMYNPKARPFVSHPAGTELVIEHIEKYWAPTVLSEQLMQAIHDAN